MERCWWECEFVILPVQGIVDCVDPSFCLKSWASFNHISQNEAVLVDWAALCTFSFR